MHKPTLLLTTTLATITLALALTTPATAGRLSTSSQTARILWTPLNLGAGEVTIRCNVTLEASFHYSSIIKQVGSLIGYVTRAAAAHPCTNGEAWALNGVEFVLGATVPNTLPWHLTYEGFEGTLPNITGIRFLITPSISVNVAGVLCLYGTNVQGVLKLARGVGTNLIPDSTIALSKVSGGILCPSSGTFGQDAGAGNTVTVLGSTSAITITLI